MSVRNWNVAPHAFVSLACLATALTATAVRAQVTMDQGVALLSSKFEIDDADPTRKIPTVAERDEAPLDFAYFLMNLSEKAEHFEKRGDRAAQIKYLRGIAAAVPDRSVGFSKLCAAFEANQQLVEAEQSCAAAVALPGATFDDFARYVRVVFTQSELNPAQIENLDAVRVHLEREAPKSSVLLDLQCQLALRTNDAKRFASCATALEQLPANDTKRLTYSFLWSIGQRNFAAAERVIEQAKASTTSSGLVEKMTEARSAALPWWRRTFERHPGALSLGTIVLLLLGASLVYLRHRRTFGGVSL